MPFDNTDSGTICARRARFQAVRRALARSGDEACWCSCLGHELRRDGILVDWGRDDPAPGEAARVVLVQQLRDWLDCPYDDAFALLGAYTREHKLARLDQLERGR
jgi:hypothetical protein